MKNSLRRIVILMFCLFILAANGCGKKSMDERPASGTGSSTSANSSADMPSQSNGGMEKSKGSEADMKENTKDASDQRKVIKKSRLDIETKHFDDAVNFIIERTDREKGYIQNSNIQGGKLGEGQYAANRYAEFTLRIPVDKLNTFLKDAEAIGVVVNRSDNDEDVTSQYFDTEARVKTLKIQEERLLNILQKSDKLTDIIELEKRLSELRNEIESLTGTLKKYDNLVAMATVNIAIREVQTESQVKVKPVTFGDKIADGFKQSVSALYEIIKGIILLVVYVIPFAAAALILFIPGRILFKRYFKAKTQREDGGTEKEEK